MNSRILTVVAALTLGALMPAGVVAQSTGGGGGWGGHGFAEGDQAGRGGGWGQAPAGRALPAADVDRIVGRLRQITAYCGWFGRGYEIDCLRDQYEQMRRWLPSAASYAPLRQALWQAERELDAVVRANATPRAAPGVAPPRGNPTGLRASRALTQATGAAAANAARAVIDRTSTVLLRSATAGDPRRLAFQRVAQAIDSNKVLLRSRA